MGTRTVAEERAMKALRAVTIALTVALLPAAVTAAPSMDRRPQARESVSPDGRFVAFTQGADVFLRDNDDASVTLVSRAAGTNAPANAPSIQPVVSADGAYVVFVSHATNLVRGHVDAAGAANVFLFERVTGKVTLVSRSATRPAATANGASAHAAISGDGAHVVFESLATDLVAGQIDEPRTPDVFLYERATGRITLVSHATGAKATVGNGISTTPVISVDGTTVVFQSFASNLVAGQDDANGERDVFLHDRATGTTRLASHRPGAPGVSGNGPSFLGIVSANGAYLAFESQATDLVRGQRDENGERDVFLYERATGTVTLVSHASGSATAAGDRESFLELISPDGASVVFESVATDLVAGQSIGSRALYVYGRVKGTVLFVMPTLASR
jgi:Tol biopolymer transport system component